MDEAAHLRPLPERQRQRWRQPGQAMLRVREPELVPERRAGALPHERGQAAAWEWGRWARTSAMSPAPPHAWPLEVEQLRSLQERELPRVRATDPSRPDVAASDSLAASSGQGRGQDSREDILAAYTLEASSGPSDNRAWARSRADNPGASHPADSREAEDIPQAWGIQAADNPVARHSLEGAQAARA